MTDEKTELAGECGRRVWSWSGCDRSVTGLGNTRYAEKGSTMLPKELLITPANDIHTQDTRALSIDATGRGVHNYIIGITKKPKRTTALSNGIYHSPGTYQGRNNWSLVVCFIAI